MIKEGTVIQLKEFSVIDSLSKKESDFPLPPSVLFHATGSYYKHIHFNIDLDIDSYHFRPSFFFAHFRDTCRALKEEEHQTICYTKHLRIELEDAIQHGEIEILDHEPSSSTDETVIAIDEYKSQLLHHNENYQQGLITQEEFIAQIISLNQVFCMQQEKWKHLIPPSYFIGGTAKELI